MLRDTFNEPGDRMEQRPGDGWVIKNNKFILFLRP